MGFNLQDAVKNIYDMKVGWHTSDKAGDRKKADEYAENAKQYYQQLIDNGYEDVANVLKNTNDVGAKSYYDNLMKNYSAPVTTSKSNTPTATADLTKADGMSVDLYGVQRADKDTISKKYDTAEDYIYNYDHTKSATGKAILDNYKFQGETARDNATASGGASNGGNIDSYAAANANRQQLAYTNAGMNAILNDFNARINGIRGLLNDMGINLQNQYKSMQDTIGLKQTDEQRTFENSETSKNNDVDRGVKVSEVTGYVPEKWSYANNFYLDENGNLKPEYENVDFSAVMAEAKKNGNTELYDQASIARAKKIYGNYEKWGKYDDGNYALAGRQQTESGRRFDKEVDTTERMNSDDNATTKYTSDNSLTGTKYTTDASERMNESDNATNLTIKDKELSAKSDEGEEKIDWSDFSKVAGVSNDDIVTRNFIAHNLQPLIDSNLKLFTSEDGEVYYETTDADGKTTQKPFKDLLVSNASTITKDGAKKIWHALGLPGVSWVEEYTWYGDKKDFTE